MYLIKIRLPSLLIIGLICCASSKDQSELTSLRPRYDVFIPQATGKRDSQNVVSQGKSQFGTMFSIESISNCSVKRYDETTVVPFPSTNTLKSSAMTNPSSSSQQQLHLMTRRRDEESRDEGASWRQGVRTRKASDVTDRLTTMKNETGNGTYGNMTSEREKIFHSFGNQRTMATLKRPLAVARRFKRNSSWGKHRKQVAHRTFVKKRRTGNTYVERRLEDAKKTQRRNYLDEVGSRKRFRRKYGRLRAARHSGYNDRHRLRRQGNHDVNEAQEEEVLQRLLMNPDEMLDARNLMRRSDVTVHMAVAKSTQFVKDYAKMQELAARRSNVGAAGGISVSFPAAAKTPTASQLLPTNQQQKLTNTSSQRV